jgi:RHS repeat-associated protein
LCDSETGLYYYPTRWYDPQVGRFILEDPIGFGSGVNWYTYVYDNPTKYKDPSGLKIWVCSRLTHPPEKWVGANHSYFFDDRNNESCGLSGPRKARYPLYGSTSPEKGPKDGGACRPVDGSDDPNKADQIMSCCKNYKAVTYIPGYNDCHNLTDSCLASAGFKDPGAPGGRFGERCVKCGKATPWWKIW